MRKSEFKPLRGIASNLLSIAFAKFEQLNVHEFILRAIQCKWALDKSDVNKVIVLNFHIEIVSLIKFTTRASARKMALSCYFTKLSKIKLTFVKLVCFLVVQYFGELYLDS